MSWRLAHLAGMAALASLVPATGHASSVVEIYQCEPHRGKATPINGQPANWKDDAYGTSTVLLDGKRFYIAAGSYVPATLRGPVDDPRTARQLVVTSRDEDHVMGVMTFSGSAKIFHFHHPTRTLMELSTHINLTPHHEGQFRTAFVGAYVAQCELLR